MGAGKNWIDSCAIVGICNLGVWELNLQQDFKATIFVDEIK